MTALSVANYLANRLADLGIDRIFGVPGDYTFSFDDAIEACPRLHWILNANELNAAYAADGFARIFGIAALTTTYGVGELSALNGVMGSKCHRLPIIHIVGAPSRRIVYQDLITHHSLGDGVYGNFEIASASAACVSAILSPENAISEIERVITETLRHSRPGYIVLPMDIGKLPVIGTPQKGRHISQIKRQSSIKKELDEAIDAIIERLNAAKNPVVLPNMLVSRYGLQPKLDKFLKKANIPYATTPMDKGVLSEGHPCYLGLYNGDYSAPPSVKSIIENADLILDLGGIVMAELNAGLWSDMLPKDRMIHIHDNWVQIGDNIWLCAAIEDVLDALIDRTPTFSDRVATPTAAPLTLVGSPEDPTSSENFYPRLQRMLQVGDILISETGTCMLHLCKLLLPAGVGYQSQVVWGSIGWATPAAIGIAMAQQCGRTILVTGDGAHGMTLNELSVMGRYNIKPIIFVLNNDMHGVEEIVGDEGHVFNLLPIIDYHKLPEALGCKNWLTAKVSTVAELESILAQIDHHDDAAYISVTISKSESKPLPIKVRERMYKVATPDG